MSFFKDKLQSATSLEACSSGNNGEDAVAAIKVVPVANSAAANIVTVSNAPFGQASTLTIPDPAVAAASFVLNPFPGGVVPDNIIVKNIVCGQAALASAGKVNIQAHTSATSQFLVLDVNVCKSTGLSGNSGNRLLAVTDGTIAFNSTGITAALLGTPINTVWGGSGNPFSTTVGFDAPSTAGADLYFQYIGGTTDYNAGTITIQVMLKQVTA